MVKTVFTGTCARLTNSGTSPACQSCACTMSERCTPGSPAATRAAAWLNAAKRRAEVVSLTEELAACVPGADGGREQEMRELGALLSDFLRSLPQESRLFFLRRYWFMDSVKEIAARYAVGESRVKTSLFRTRRKLRDYLEKEGISV